MFRLKLYYPYMRMKDVKSSSAAAWFTVMFIDMEC
jgi:hypothetical protein